MYAVIKAGGKQHRVKAGDVIEIELVHGHDDTMTFSPLLVVDDDGKAHVGKDLGKAVVKAKLVGEQKGDKVKVFKYRPKSGYARRQGHRQMYTLVEIQDVSLGARRAPAKKADVPAEADGEPEPEPAPAAAKAARKPAPKPPVGKTPTPKPDPHVEAPEEP